jgi:hypothetical protein
LRCLSFGCGHVARLLGQAGKKFHNFRLFGTISRFREFQGSGNQFLRNARVGMRCKGPVPSTRL